MSAANSAPDDLLPWAADALGVSEASCQLEVVSGDASARRYFRLQVSQSSYIVAHAPPATEKNAEFVARQELLAAAGVAVPSLLAVDLARGYLLQQDLGDTDLLSALTGQSVDAYYQRALSMALQLAQLAVHDASFPQYDRALLTEELSRFPHWFVGELLDGEMDESVFAKLQTLLIDSALAQPKVLVHRDFHSRNLMLCQSQLVLIDFQDAVMGPVSYDAVSLLRDCYIRWPERQVDKWAGEHFQQLKAAGLTANMHAADFQRAFDLMGLQRHIKVLGTFARLYLRDGKQQYLQDLPRVLAYVHDMLSRYADEPACADFHSWCNEQLQPAINRQPWSQTP